MEIILPKFTLPESRTASDSHRGLWSHRIWGSMSPFYCISCHKPAPYIASEAFFYGLFWMCNQCVMKFGSPPQAVEVTPEMRPTAG